MPNALLHATAERHRLIASGLTDPRDRAIVNRFADEIEDLARLEVAVPPPLDREGGYPRRGELAFLFGRIYRPAQSLVFEELLDTLEAGENSHLVC